MREAENGLEGLRGFASGIASYSASYPTIYACHCFATVLSSDFHESLISKLSGCSALFCFCGGCNLIGFVLSPRCLSQGLAHSGWFMKDL